MYLQGSYRGRQKGGPGVRRGGGAEVALGREEGNRRGILEEGKVRLLEEGTQCEASWRERMRKEGRKRICWREARERVTCWRREEGRQKGDYCRRGRWWRGGAEVNTAH